MEKDYGIDRILPKGVHEAVKGVQPAPRGVHNPYRGVQGVQFNHQCSEDSSGRLSINFLISASSVSLYVIARKYLAACGWFS